LDDRDIGNILQYVDDFLIRSWLKNSNIKFPVFKSDNSYNEFDTYE